MRVLFVNDTGARGGNPGCQLTSRTLEGLLSAQDARHTSLPWRFGQRLNPRSKAVWAGLANGRILEEPLLRELAETEYGDGATRAATDTDMVLFQPEGTISDAHDALRILRLLSLPLWAALHGRVPVVVANGTFPLFDDHRAALIRLLLHHADRRMLRDRIAARHWQTDCAPDSAVLWQGMPQRPDADGVLITTAAEGSTEGDLAICRAALDYARATGLRPLVLTKGWQRLLPIRAEVEALGGSIAQTTDLDATDDAISDCRMHIGGRYHMALLCATKGIPSALVRSNTHKNLWLDEEFSGIGVAAETAGLPALAKQLAAAGGVAMLADVARLGTETRAAYAALPPERDAPIQLPTLPPDTLAYLRAEARRDRWRGFLRSLTRRK